MKRVQSKFWSRIVRCGLVLVAWQAPLPFWHNHGTLANAASDVAPWLAEHMRTHHAAVDPLSQFVFGWHIHFTFPDHEDDEPDAPQPVRPQLVVAGGLASWDAFARLQASPASRTDHDASAVPNNSAVDRALFATWRSGGFFTNFVPDLPLPVRLGVLRC